MKAESRTIEYEDTICMKQKGLYDEYHRGFKNGVLALLSVKVAIVLFLALKYCMGE